MTCETKRLDACRNKGPAMTQEIFLIRSLRVRQSSGGVCL
jgi:hypothetical protein